MSERADHNERASAAIQPRLLTADEAADYLKLCVESFLKEVDAGTFPGPVALRRVRRNLWDRLALDKALDALMGGVADGYEARKAAWREGRQGRQKDARRRDGQGIQVRSGRA